MHIQISYKQFQKINMENTKQQLTIEKLNASYTKLIKMVLNRTISTSTPYITSFYRDPTPEQAYQLLTKILAEETSHTQDYTATDANDNNNEKKFQLKRALTTVANDKQTGYRISDVNDLNLQSKNNNPSRNLKKAYTTEFDDARKEGDYDTQSKNQKLKRITAKITGIFENNHKKILKYEEISKYSPNQPKYATPVQIGFKKY